MKRKQYFQLHKHFIQLNMMHLVSRHPKY